MTRTSWALNPANRTLRVEIDIPNKNGALRPGTYATAKIVYAKPKGFYTLPVSAIYNKDGGSYCCCVVDGKIVHKTVTLGPRSGDDVEITSGLEGNEQVVRANAGSLSIGQKVRVIGS